MFVLKGVHQAIVAGYKSQLIDAKALRERLEAQIVELKAEVQKEREAARAAMSSAMSLSRLGDPYGKPRQGGIQGAISKPLGRERAQELVNRFEREERELLEKMKKEKPNVAAAEPDVAN